VELVAWILVAILWLLGLIGVFLPILPGSTLVMVSAWVYFLISPSPYPWWIATCATAVWAIGSYLDSLAAVLSAKIMGSSNCGVVGASAGMVLGTLFYPLGLIIGPLLGAFIAELVFAKRGLFYSTKAGLGAGMGFFFSKLIQLFTVICMVVVMLLGIWGASL